MKYLNAKQVLAVLEAARANSSRDWAMLLLTFRHALRSREVRQLKLSDISLTDGTIRIERAKGSVSGVQTLDAHKGEPTLDEFVALKAWLKQRVEDGSKVLFPSQKGGVMTRMQLLRLFKQYATAAGIPEELAHPHILRHSVCSIMAEQHSDIYAIQRKAAHRNISNTMIYTHVSDKQADASCREALMAAFS
jgi:type 1 fimbriae regulatory protein FimB